jgi:hypothetical protein
VRRHHEAFVSGDREGALEPLDPGIEFVFGLFELPTARGHAQVEEAVRQWLGTWLPGTYRFEPREYDDLGDMVLVRYVEHGLGRRSGVEVTREAFQLWGKRKPGYRHAYVGDTRASNGARPQGPPRTCLRLRRRKSAFPEPSLSKIVLCDSELGGRVAAGDSELGGRVAAGCW